MVSLNEIFDTPVSITIINRLTPNECQEIIKQVIYLPVGVPHIYENRYMTKEEITYFFKESFEYQNDDYLFPVALYLGSKLKCYYNKPDREGWVKYYSDLILFLINKIRGVDYERN